ncbi:succinate dehydrogenase / fumarate reductase cytochrome b subunit [Allocatelliglobosispora scoriae]|uniref:Succinate dehydrogenase / fumarate reductase cytochrome b subunit n=1 Tax=Allocatelliglobosispora scoriae TaxID=643052 RepID=A0A841BFY8_9ACTN|nr:succinate dehydrogenase cytochrome b subunit [Allocatelliglobosispora scoriae]MBB5867204.1 succinate dehydrogenase / fumarate reductase cytochrome b subunit [Allocatelliglobosispora scoriae]
MVVASPPRARAAVPLPPRATRPTPGRSTVALKALMAGTGLLLVGFLLAHMAGNLKIFVGGEAFDHYAHWLRGLGSPVLPETGYLWLQRTVLSLAVVGHIWAATVLTVRAKKARPVRYAHRKPVQGSYAARTMRWGGVIVLAFIVWHILDLTVGAVNPVGDPAHPFANVVADFAPSRWYITAFYALSIILLGFHLRHGVWSALQTLGVSNARRQRALKGVALALAVVLVVGYLSVPFAVMTGLVK